MREVLLVKDVETNSIFVQINEFNKKKLWDLQQKNNSSD